MSTLTTVIRNRPVCKKRSKWSIWKSLLICSLELLLRRKVKNNLWNRKKRPVRKAPYPTFYSSVRKKTVPSWSTNSKWAGLQMNLRSPPVQMENKAALLKTLIKLELFNPVKDTPWISRRVPKTNNQTQSQLRFEYNIKIKMKKFQHLVPSWNKK